MKPAPALPEAMRPAEPTSIPRRRRGRKPRERVRLTEGIEAWKGRAVREASRLVESCG